MTEPPVGLLGLGLMGGAVAGQLLAAGHPVAGYDPSDDRRRDLTAAGGWACASIAEVAAAADILISLLPTQTALAEVVDELCSARDAGNARELVLAEMSTYAVSTKLAARHRLARHGIAMLDCALSGTAVQAVRGDVAVYASGDAADIDRCRAVLRACGKTLFELGPFGAATQTKLVANELVAIHIAAAAEALAFARQAGLDLDLTLRAITAGAGSSRMLEVRGPMMASDTYLPASTRMALFLKDLDIIEASLREAGAPSALFAAAVVYFRAALADG